MSTESSISWQHLKESALPNTCPKTTDPQQCHWHLHGTADTPQFRQGNLATFLKQGIAEIITARNFPSPCAGPVDAWHVFPCLAKLLFLTGVGWAVHVRTRCASDSNPSSS